MRVWSRDQIGPLGMPAFLGRKHRDRLVPLLARALRGADPLARAARKWGQPLASRQVKIIRSRLGESAGILGSARYAMLKLEGQI